jgi:hypothetical protein
LLVGMILISNLIDALIAAAQQLIQPDRPIAFLSSLPSLIKLNASCGRRVNSGVMSPLRVEFNQSSAAPLLCGSSVERIIREAG